MIQAQNLRQIKLRIKSIESTRKITRAMEMVSASKLSRVKMPFFMMKPYILSLQSLMHSIISDSPELKSPLIEERKVIKSSTLCVITSDTGLCGTYNNNVIDAAENFLSSLRSPKVSVVAIGREGYNYFLKKGFNISGSYLGLYGKFSKEIACDITENMIKMFLTAETDEIYVAYSIFNPSLRHSPFVEKLLPIEQVTKPRRYYIYEPSAQALFDKILSKYLNCKFREILLESFTCEHSARMLAMKTATDNADDLIGELTLARNKARQFAITKEVLEIAASAEALKG